MKKKNRKRLTLVLHIKSTNSMYIQLDGAKHDEVDGSYNNV